MTSLEDMYTAIAVDARHEAAKEDTHLAQQYYRYGKKPFSAQFTDALSEEVFEKNIEYVEDPLETAFYVHAGDSATDRWTEIDDPYFSPENITEQLPYFEQLDTEQELWLLREPTNFKFPSDVRNWESIVHFSLEYARRRTPVPYDPIHYSIEVSEYIQKRIGEVTYYAQRRQQRLWSEHEVRRPGKLSLKYLIDTGQITTNHIPA